MKDYDPYIGVWHASSWSSPGEPRDGDRRYEIELELPFVCNVIVEPKYEKAKIECGPVEVDYGKQEPES